MGAIKEPHSAEEIIRKLRQPEVMLHDGKQMVEVCRALGVSDSTLDKLILQDAVSGK